MKPQRNQRESVSAGRVPPQNLEAEQSVLGAVMLSNQAFYDLPSTLKAEDFYFTSHRVLFGVMAEMLTKGDPVDIVTLPTVLKDRGLLDTVDGAAYVASLSNVVPSTANVGHYARIVSEASTRRRLAHAHNEAVKLAHDPSIEVKDIQKRIDELLIEVDAGTGQAIVRSEREIAVALFKRVEKSLDDPTHKISERAFKTGLDCIDNVLRVTKQDLVVIAADSGGGKSMFMQQVAGRVGMGPEARNVLIAPLEMSGEQMVQRRMMDVGSMYLDDVFRPRSDYALKQFVDTVERITRESKVHYVERAWDLPTILREASRWARRCVCKGKADGHHELDCKGLALLIIDYLQILDFSSEWGERRDEQIGKATRMLKRWTGLHDVPVMFASQLRRRKDDEIPRLNDLRESGNLGNDANAVGILYRPCEILGTEEHKRRSDADLRKVIFLLEKQRMGQAQVEIELVHHFEHARFADPLRSDAAEPQQQGLPLDGQTKPSKKGAHA